MLIQLLEYLQSGKTYSVQELAELLHKDVGSIQVELEYLENQGYIRKVAYQADCNHNCNGCHGCDPGAEAAAGGSVCRTDAADRHPGPAYLRPVLPGHDGGRDRQDRGC